MKTIISGIEYRTLSSALKAIGATQGSFYAWQRKNPGKVIDDYVVYREARPSFTYEGETYRSVLEYCNKTGNSYNSLRAFISKNKSPDKTIPQLIEEHRSSSTRFVVNGISYNSMQDYCTKHNLHINALSNFKYRNNLENISPVELVELFENRNSNSRKLVVNQEPSVIKAKSNNEIELAYLAEFRLHTQTAKMSLVDNKSVKEIHEYLQNTGKITVDFLEFDNGLKLCEMAHADPIEVYYLVTKCDMEINDAIRVARKEITIADLHIPPKDVEVYCANCGEVIEHKFLKSHPGTKFCRCCYDKQNK